MKKFQELISEGSWSKYFQADYNRKSYTVPKTGERLEKDQEYNVALSERQLFTQSNARVLLGQDTVGRIHFLSVPHEKDYALPTRKTSSHQHITACPGMFYQTDMIMLMGKGYYKLRTEKGESVVNGQHNSKTCYLNDFLPWTRTELKEIRMDTVSLAPVLEKPCRKGLKTLPLPGPSGAIYGMCIENKTNQIIRGTVEFHFEDLFVSKYEHSGVAMEDRAFPSQYQQIDRNMLLLQRPEGYAGIYMKDGYWRKSREGYVAERIVELKPKEEMVIETILAIGEETETISEAMSILFMHDMAEWIEITDRFWKKYLGNLRVFAEGYEILAEKSKDIHIRNIIDNFNCIQTDENGRVLVHWQGAPSHCIGRMWGIDVEPTTLSFIHMFPELGEKLIEYMVDRNEPRYSEFPEHSVPIMMAPLVMAGEYFYYTGNIEYFKENKYVLQRLDEIWKKIVGFCKIDCALVPSRYSSDGIVMRRYDHGTNVKFWYASMGYKDICKSLGREHYKEVERYAQNLKEDIIKYMVKEGPFGMQITGGTNLGEQGDFYMDENFFYYDGEDSSSVLAPVYGIYEFTYEPWINYHRFARSLFCSNYDPEMNTLRWFPYGGALDGTAYVSQLGGSITRKEMADSLNNMIQSAIDETGSLYWWPKAENRRRLIARCSQGQGSWIIQYIKQWLGIKMNAEKKTLTIQPQGLLTEFQWEGAYLGGYVFDIKYHEDSDNSTLRIMNHNSESFKIIFVVRDYGSGAEGSNKVIEDISESDKELMIHYTDQKKHVADVAFRTEQEELYHFADENKIMFGHYGFHQPSLESIDQKNIFLLRMVLGNGNTATLSDVKVEFQYPSWMKMKEKRLRLWDDVDVLDYNKCLVCKNEVLSGERIIIPVWVELDRAFDAQNVWFDGHPFFFGSKRKVGKMIISSEGKEIQENIKVKLQYRINEKLMYKEVLIPVVSMKKEKLQRYTKTFLGTISE